MAGRVVKKSPEVKRQPRGEKTRLLALDAALRIIARDGTAAVSHRAVAAEAGTSVRATTYYFASKNDLLTEAFVLYTERAIARFDGVSELLPEKPPTVASAAQLIAETIRIDLEDDRAGLVAEYEMVLEIGRNPALAEPYAKWQDALLRMLEQGARVFGSTQPKLHAKLLLALIRGIEIEALTRPADKVDVPAITKLIAVAIRSVFGA